MRRSFLLAAAAPLFAAGVLSAQPVAPVPVAPPPGPGRPAAPPTAAEPKTDELNPGPKREKPTGPPEFEAKFVDDSVLKVTALESTLTVSTKYGTLTIPLADVVRIEVGFRFPEGVEEQVTRSIEALGAPAFREREEAEKVLYKQGEFAVPALRRAAKSGDPEVARRAGSLLKRLVEKLPEEKLALKDFDLVETTDATVRGRVETARVKISNRVLGETALRMADLRSLRSTAAVGNEITVDSKYARQNDPAWLDTGIDITADQPLQITAEGTMDMAPQQMGQFVCTPAGNANNGQSMLRMPNGGGMQVIPGGLYARIGPTGNPFLIGTSHKTSRPPAEGRLFLKVGPSTWGGMEPNGSYKVKIRIGG